MTLENKNHKNIEGYQYNGETNNERLNQRMDMWKYDEPIWGTYTQWVKNERYVKRGEKGTCLFGVNRDDSLRFFSVFNISQTKKFES